MDPNCPFQVDDELSRYYVPLLCFLCRVANNGHAFEASIGTPKRICWFSTPDLYNLQLFEAGLFLMLLTMLIVLPLSDIIGSRSLRGWDWKTDVRLIGGLAVTAWLEMCLVSTSRYLLNHIGDHQPVLTETISRCAFWLVFTSPKQWRSGQK